MVVFEKVDLQLLKGLVLILLGRGFQSANIQLTLFFRYLHRIKY